MVVETVSQVARTVSGYLDCLHGCLLGSLSAHIVYPVIKNTSMCPGIETVCLPLYQEFSNGELDLCLYVQTVCLAY